MIVEKVTPEFAPISFMITIQNEIEYNALKDILGRNMSIPQMMYDHDQPEFSAVKDVLDNLRKGIYDL